MNIKIKNNNDRKIIIKRNQQDNIKLFSATYGDFARFDAKPNEDAFLISKKFPIFALADGVTQSHYPNQRYALPYGAKKAAQIFCYTTVKLLEKTPFTNSIELVNGKKTGKQTEKIIKNAIKNAFNLANEKIKELNYKHGINEKTMDYVTHDWFDTVGILAIIIKNNLYYGLVGDCGLIIFNKNNKKKFQTKDMVKPAVKKFKEKYPDYETFSPQKRAYLIHKEFRNNSNGKGYGSFSGEQGVKKYYHLGSKKMQKGDRAVLYSDGFFELLKNSDFIEVLKKQNKKEMDKFVMKKAKENPKKYGHDRTFISITF